MFAVWEPILPTDLLPPSTSTLARLPDTRVRQFYDPDHLVAQRLQADARPPQPETGCCRSHGTLWDLLAIYPADATWTDRMPTAVIFNGPVVNAAGALESYLAHRPD